ncbi:MAG: hypothetical protein PF569_09685 [Candidatus Woesearchaeota archaeon]|jgi:uncharacterized ion transporter superfamily protein YfcC|nr:hypothetical protein [Candidatus Woesearchaeota archaeon]
MIKNKKSQLFLLSSLFLLLLLIFIYSIETENTYIVKSGKFNLLNNIVYETCKVGKFSNGTYIDSRYLEFENDLESYCISYGYLCNLTITNNTIIPPSGNWSLLNYTHYDYHIDYRYEGYNYSSSFIC